MGLKSRAYFAFLTTRRPVDVIHVPFRAIRVGNTQSNISIPRIEPSINDPGEPTPIKYRGLSEGIRGVVYSNILFITSLGSPTDNLPIVYLGKNIEIISLSHFFHHYLIFISLIKFNYYLFSLLCNYL